jgi:hypothetical protein
LTIASDVSTLVPRTRLANTRCAAAKISSTAAGRHSPALSRTSSAGDEAEARESRDKSRSSDMANSSDRAGLPETGTGTLQRSCQGSATAARTQAHQVRADLDREDGVQG